MQRVTLPSTSLMVSRLAFGTASLHHLVAASGQRRLLHSAYEHGYSHFDTAPMYGEGMSERALGNVFDRGLRGQITLATKVGYPARRIPQLMPPVMYLEKTVLGGLRRFGISMGNARRRELSPEALETSFSASLRRLRTDYVDILFVHEPAEWEIDLIGRACAWLLRQRDAGKIRYLGLAGQALPCVKIATAFPGVFDVLQVKDSLDRHEADAACGADRPLQVTYGYFRNAMQQKDQGSAGLTDARGFLARVLTRNPSGTVIVSTRSLRRLVEMARLAEDLGSSGISVA